MTHSDSVKQFVAKILNLEVEKSTSNRNRWGVPGMGGHYSAVSEGTFQKLKQDTLVLERILAEGKSTAETLSQAGKVEGSIRLLATLNLLTSQQAEVLINELDTLI